MNGLRYVTVNEVIEELQKMVKEDPSIGDTPVTSFGSMSFGGKWHYTIFSDLSGLGALSIPCMRECEESDERCVMFK